MTFLAHGKENNSHDNRYTLVFIDCMEVSDYETEIPWFGSSNAEDTATSLKNVWSKESKKLKTHKKNVCSVFTAPRYKRHFPSVSERCKIQSSSQGIQSI
jgi:hypothetical protein